MRDINLLPPTPFLERNRLALFLLLIALFLALLTGIAYDSLGLGRQLATVQRQVAIFQENVRMINQLAARTQGLQTAKTLNSYLNALAGKRVNWQSHLAFIFQVLPPGATISSFTNSTPDQIEVEESFNSLDDIALYMVEMQADPRVDSVNVKSISGGQQGQGGTGPSQLDLLALLQKLQQPGGAPSGGTAGVPPAAGQPSPAVLGVALEVNLKSSQTGQ